jgi:hypothetical protein
MTMSLCSAHLFRLLSKACAQGWLGEVDEAIHEFLFPAFGLALPSLIESPAFVFWTVRKNCASSTSKDSLRAPMRRTRQ